MSCIIVLTPVISAAWPVISQVVLSTLTNMGYSRLGQELAEEAEEKRKGEIELEVKNASAIADTLKQESKLILKKEGIFVTFAKDVRGKCKVTVRGENRSKEELTKLGEEICQKVVQQYVYNKIKDELKKKNFTIVEEKVSSDDSIKISVRKWG